MIPSMPLDKPIFSIVIATYNAESFLERALNSIFSQIFPNFEILIQDGGSTDNTIKILRKYIKKINYFDSEKDNGIYDAWNKILPHIKGEWTLFLGADDFLATPETLNRCATYLHKAEKHIIYAYGCLVFIHNNKIISMIDRSIHEVFTIFPYNMGLPFPATFIKSSFIKQNKFDNSYKIAGDFALVAKTITLKNTLRIPEHISYMEFGDGLSSSESTYYQLLKERKKVLKEIILPRSQDIIQYCIESIEMKDKLNLSF